MRMALRFIVPLLLVLGGIAWAATPVLSELLQRWFRADVESRSQLVFDSINDTVARLVKDAAGPRIDLLFQHITRDERLLAVGLCAPDGRLSHRSTTWPKTLGCPRRAGGAPAFTVAPRSDGAVLTAVFPLSHDKIDLGDLIIVHDLSFIERRGAKLERYLAVFIAALGLVIAAVTVAVALAVRRGWVRAVRKGLAPIVSGRAPEPEPEPEIARLVAEMREMLRDLDVPRGISEAIRVDWNPDTLRHLLKSELPGAEVIVVSNREPYIHNREGDTIRVQRPASGLVTALEPITRACGGTWIAHGSGSADEQTVDRQDHLQVPPEAPAYTLRRVWLSEEEQEGYYYGLANEGLWPLCHIVFVRPTFRASDWAQYVAVNRKFAEAVVAEAQSPNPLVLVQDYHFALLPQMVRERLPGATIITFWHIPWPNPEVFGICPWREEILQGLLGSSILGFHTQFHCLNFLDSVDRFLECHIDREQSTARTGGRTTLVRPYPISIEWPPTALVGQPPVAECRVQVRRSYDLDPAVLLAVGVERFDYTKGIADRFRAVENLLEHHPEWIGRFTLLQIAAPTRSKLPAYRQTQAEAEAVATGVNQRFGRPGWWPIALVARHHEPEQVFTLFRAADLCLVSSLHDGMNLVAKEFVAARDDDDGVLVLSSFAGVSRELLEALIVNPYDSGAMAEAIHRALLMPREQRRERMHLMRALVSEHNIYFWAGRMLLEAARLRKRQRIEDQIVEVTAPFNWRRRGGRR
ncbi:alpha,alpha-trehalose-phosphate synthase (UDP-forming) [Candidatus Thiodictyon syntrophicum]|uniref:alpha,alpha-trehalose-phosphate synthase (UDP-forming) n=1 Tax=Candidatus Thiodictyon syntrophicum TaxID=1166950 RepID=UPI001C12C93F|nr:trehalose-6-phosphate synthase [Candidatus Thiodictyon syntrophicum]